MSGRKKSSGPVACSVGGKAARIREDDERWQVLVHAAEPVGNPRAHRRKSWEHEAGILHERRRAMHVRFRNHGMHERQIVSAGCQVRRQTTDPFSGVAVLFPFPRAGHDCAGAALKELDLAARIEFLAVALDEKRLVIEGVALAGCART